MALGYGNTWSQRILPANIIYSPRRDIASRLYIHWGNRAAAPPLFMQFTGKSRIHIVSLMECDWPL